jgi:hypothetical protein
VDKLGDRETRRCDKLSREGALDGDFLIDEAYVAARFEEAARFREEDATLMIGAGLGLTDVQGRPRNEWAKQLLVAGKKVHRRAEPCFYNMRI